MTTSLFSWFRQFAVIVDQFDEFIALHTDQPLSDMPAIEVYDQLLAFAIMEDLDTTHRDRRLIIRATAEALRNSWADRVFPPPDPDSAASFDECERAGVFDGTLRS